MGSRLKLCIEQKAKQPLGVIMTDSNSLINQLFRWENPHSRRFYVCFLHKDLLNDIILTIVNGGLNSRRGRVRHHLCESVSSGERLIERIHHRRLQRGYEAVQTST